MKIKMEKTLLFGGNRYVGGETVETDDLTGKMIVKAGFAVEEKAAEPPAETPAEEKAAKTPAKGKKAAKK